MGRRRRHSLAGIAVAILIAALVGHFRGLRPIRAPWAERSGSAAPAIPEAGNPVAQSPIPSQSPRYRVERVVDGDTIVVMMDGVPTKVRLIGVDTPETVDPRKPVQRFGREASRFTKDLLTGREVRLEFERGTPSRDRYQRVLAYVYRAPDDYFVNAQLVRLGYGHAYTRFPFKYLEQFRQYEREAREAGRGLWGSESPPAAPTARPSASRRR